MIYQWKLIDFHDKVEKSGEFQAKTVNAAKAKATKASGIQPRIWSNWYETRKNWCRDNDIFGTAASDTLRMLVLTVKEANDEI